VFRATLNAIVTHAAPGSAISSAAIAKVIHENKLSKPHAKEVWETIGLPQPEVVKVLIPEPKPIPAYRGDGEPARVEPEVVPASGDAEVVLVSRKPWIINPRAVQAKQIESESSYQLTYSDGSVKYECKVCGQLFDNPRAVGGHKGLHVKKGEAEVSSYTESARVFQQGQRKEIRQQRREKAATFVKAAGGDRPEPQLIREVDPELEQMLTEHVNQFDEPSVIPEPPPIPFSEMILVLEDVARMQDVLKQIAKLASSEELSEILQENSMLREENERLRGELQALADIFDGIRK